MKGFKAAKAALMALGLATASGASAQVVISQAYPGGTLSGATYNQRFVEVFNRGAAPVDLAGHTIQYASPTGTGSFAVHATLTGTVPAGGYFLVAYPASGSSAALPVTPDGSATGSPGGTNGKLALVNSTSALACNGGSTPCSPEQTALIVDLVGYGTANFFEGSAAAPAFSATLAGFRANGGCTDSNNNSADFASATPLPRNSASALNSCAAPVPTLEIAAASEFEGNSGQSPLSFALTLSGPAPTGGLRVLATTSNGSATAGDDYVALTDAEFTIAAGQTTANVVVQMIGDSTNEPDETLTVTLTLPNGGAVFGASNGGATGTIRNDDASTAVLSIAPAADVAEGTTGTTPQVFVASLSGPLPTDVSLTASTSDITATAGQDYVSFSDRAFVIAAGQTSVQIPVDVIGDRDDEANESYRVTIASTSPSVTLGSASADGVIVDDDLPFTEIFSIQGSGVCSSFVATCNVSANVTGDPARSRANIVTSVGASGFTMQTPDARDDGNVLTSNGIYVFTAGAPRNDAGALIAVGDQVEVVGRVAEFFSLTQIVVNSTRDAANSILTEATGQPLPASVLFGNATPNALAAGVTTLPSRNPDALSCGPLGNFECFEGMRISMFDSAVTVANQRFSTDLYGEVWISPYGERGIREKGARFGNTLVPSNAAAGVWDGNPEIIEMDADFLLPGNAGLELAGGTRFAAEGVIGFDFGDYEFWPTTLNILEGSNQVVRPVPAAAASELTIGSFNAFRLCDAVRDNPAPSTNYCAATLALETNPERVTHQLGQVSAYIREVLRSPDVVGLQEVENLGILQQLATQIAADGGPAYVAYLVEGFDVGGIDVGYLVNPARVTVDAVTQLAASETWNDPSGTPTSILHDRPPLLLSATFIGNGRPFAFNLINNHTRSRGGVDVSDADGQRIRAKRFLQARSIATLVQGLQTDPATAQVPLFVIGDHNAYQFTDGYVDVVGLVAGVYNNDENTCAPANSVTDCELPGGANIVSPPMINTVDLLPEAEQYSYKFTESFGAIQGSTGRDVATNQVLDHGLFNSVAAPYVTGMAYGRANVDASAQRFRVCNFTNRDLNLCPQGTAVMPAQSWVPTGSSDHDGFVIFISPPLPDAIFANGFETID